MTDALAKVKKKLQDEITTLEHEMSVELPKELMKARAHGDLSENAEYKYAKERQGYVSARLGQLKKRLGDLGMLNLNNIPADRAGYGSRVWVLAQEEELTHGNKANFSGRFYEVVHYGVNSETEQIDYDQLAKMAQENRPKMITAGASAYPRVIDFKKMREIADMVGAWLFVDIAHIAGLVATGVHPTPVGIADFVTTTTHKSLRGPRGGVVMCKPQHAKSIDSMIFPGVQGGPLMHVIAAKAVCFHEALQPGFKDYQVQITLNAKALAASLHMKGYRLVSGGTDNHLMLVDLRSKGMNGKQAQEILDQAGITVNKNSIPFDTEAVFKGGGIRIGTPAVTTRGMKEEDMMEIADLIDKALTSGGDQRPLSEVRPRSSVNVALPVAGIGRKKATQGNI